MAKRTRPRSEASDPATAASRGRRAPTTRDQRGDDPGARPEALSDVGATNSPSAVREPTDEDIRQRAYQRYLKRGGGHGMDFEDWLEAERELKSRS